MVCYVDLFVAVLLILVDIDFQMSRPGTIIHSRAPSQDRPLRPTRPRPELQRSYSELPIKAMGPPPRPAFPPCITAINLSSDDIKRNYSVDDLQKWDKSKYPLPPLNAMTGLGRYRTSIAADPEWRTEHFRKQLSGLDGLQKMVAELDMSDINGMSNQEWQALTRPSSRRGSAISSSSTRTTSSSVGTQEPTIDPRSGARISRGFSPTAPSSARSSFGVHSRKNSTLSIILKPEAYQVGSIDSSPISPHDRRESGPLSTINEVHSNVSIVPDTIKKTPRLCKFTDRGDPDSAVCSDIEDEDDDTAWIDEAESTRVSAITQMLKEGKKPEPVPGLTKMRTNSSEKTRRKSNITTMDRTKTIRAPTGQAKQRRSSKHYNLNALHQKVKADDKYEEVDSMMLPTPESADNPPLVMQIKKPDITKGTAKQAEYFTKPAVVNDRTCFGENQLEFLPNTPRRRAPTAVFCSEGPAYELAV